MKRRQIMSKVTTPFRYDFAGSFLRPQALKDAKAAYQDGKISKDELDKVVNEEITKVVAKQKELGFHVITDGEFRRTFWHLDFMWGFEGVAHENTGNGVKFTSHICRGNYHSTYFASGPYDTVADYVFAKENVDALFLEYDDERSGGFAPLEKVSEDKKVVLGLITTKSPVLEDKEKVIARIHEAAKYVPLDRLYLSPQCGFASCEIGNKLTEEEQWAKLKLVKEIAEEAWGK